MSVLASVDERGEHATARGPRRLLDTARSRRRQHVRPGRCRALAGEPRLDIGGVHALGPSYRRRDDLHHELRPQPRRRAIALDAQDGTERWRTTLDREGRHGRALVDGRFVVAHDSGLVALDRQGGGVDWERSVEGLETSFAELLAVDRSTGTIVVPYADGLKAFGATDGQRRWKAPELPGQRVTPAIADGTVYAVGSVDGAATLAALALADGSVRWTRSLDGRSPSAPVVTDRGVLVVDDRTLVVHDRETGDRRGERHSFDYDGTTFDATVATDGTTAFVTSDDGLTAVDIADGTTRWEYDEWVYTAGCSVGTETVVAMADRGEYTDRTITAFDRETGEARWDYVMDDFHTPSIPPILADGAVFFATSSSDGLVAIGDVPE